jgi:hypothetical protein
MSVLNPTSDPATSAANQVRAAARMHFQQLARSGIQSYNAIWKNPKATPQQVIAALGTDAAAIFKLADLNNSTIQSAAKIGGGTPPAIPGVPAGYTVAFKADGSATVTQATEPASAAARHAKKK